MSTPREAPAERLPATLSRRSFYGALALLLLVFALLHPVWEPMDMAQMDRNILWSYYPIPLLVLLLLRLERKLTFTAFVLESVRLTLVKFAITFLFANAMWAWVTGPPGLPPPGEPVATVPAVASPYDPAPAPPDGERPTAPPDAVGAARCRVVDAAGAAVPDALVWVSAGLPHVAWPPPADPLRLEVDEHGFSPPLLVVRAGQPVTLAATDGLLHTAQASGPDGRMLFNYPALPGQERVIAFERALQLVRLQCHTHDQHDRPAHLLVLDHPFVGRSDDSGRITFTAVPAGTLEFSAWSAQGVRGSTEARLTTDAVAELEIRVR